jgi:hypothetical protein
MNVAAIHYLDKKIPFTGRVARGILLVEYLGQLKL